MIKKTHLLNYKNNTGKLKRNECPPRLWWEGHSFLFSIYHFLSKQLNSYKKTLIFILTILSLTSSVCSAQTVEKFEKSILKNFSAGDSRKILTSIHNLLLKYPDNPVSVLYYDDLSSLADIHGPKNILNLTRNLITKIQKNGNPKQKNLLVLKLRLQLEKILYSYSPSEAKKISNQLFPLRNWSVSGPVNRYGKGDMHNSISSAPIHNGKKLRNIIITDPDGKVRTGKYLFPEKGIATFYSKIKSESTLKIRVYSNSDYIAFINGEVVLKNTGSKFMNLRVLKAGGRQINLKLKMQISPHSEFRVIITDKNDLIYRKTKSRINSRYSQKTVLTEVMDFPYDYFRSREKSTPGITNFHLGVYYNILESSKSPVYFKKSLTYSEKSITSFFLATSLLDLSRGIKNSADYQSGLKIINTIAQNNPDFVPAQYRQFINSISSNDYRNAIMLGTELLSKTPFHFNTNMEFAALLHRLNYESEFHDHMKNFKKNFPESVLPFLAEADFFKNRNINIYHKILLKILKTYHRPKTVIEFADLYRKKGRYTDAITFLKGYNSSHFFDDSLIRLYITNRNYKKAKDIIFNRIVSSESPSYYYMLGLIDLLSKSDPLMYWSKTLSIDPSQLNLRDYISYIEDRKILSGLERFRYKKEIPTISNLSKVYKYPSTVIYKGRTFLIQKDGSSRIRCEDIIYLHTSKGVDKWGEYKIPFSGKFTAEKINVLHANGQQVNSYDIQKIDNETYLTLNGLEKHSIIHISYTIDNSPINPSGSTFFSIPITAVQDFDEPLCQLSINVISPKDMAVHFFTKPDWKVRTAQINNKKIYTITAKNSPPVQHEFFSGSHEVNLPCFSFSTMDTYNDFCQWYRGLAKKTYEKIILPHGTDLNGKNFIETVKKVYDYVSREIILQGNVIYYPEKPKNTVFNRSGSVEDKILLAQAILKEMGFKSYIAFSRKKHLPENVKFISPDYFTDMLLYVPVDSKKNIWMDFSNQYYSLGNVSHVLSGSKALILLKNGYKWKRIHAEKESYTSGKYTFEIDDSGNAKCSLETDFSGNRGTIRNYFINRMYIEDYINTYYSRIIPAFNLDDFKIKNLKNYNRPFIIKANGKCPGLAISGANRIILQPVLNKSRIYKYISYSKRKLPLFIKKPVNEKEEYIYILPVSYKKFSVDRKYKLSCTSGYAKISFFKKSGSRNLEINKSVKFKNSKIKPEDYDEFLKFCLKLKKIESKNLLIVK